MPAIQEETGSSSGLSLAIRLREGSAGAWRELVDLYGPLVDSWCARAGLPAGSRADVGQEVFLAVHRGIGRFDADRPRATFRGWLWTITRNAVLQWRRRGEVNATGGTTAMGRLAEVVDSNFSVAEAAFLDEAAADPPSTPDETAALLRRALDQIRPTVEPQTWAAFWNTAVLGRGAAEVAEELGLSAANVRQAKSRMLRRLRRQLGDK
jgi:RNA polymerase sigma-70 factor (ECF subfamily)